MKLIISLALPLLAGFLGSAFTTPNIASWYQYLNKPFFSPPNWLFAPVWTLLYLFMGVALYLVWQKKKSLSHSSLFWFWTQLLLNTLWSRKSALCFY
jgi:benzodiazapine receptor